MLGKLIEQSEAGKCLVIGTIMADRLIIKQQKISVCRFVDFEKSLCYNLIEEKKSPQFK